MLKIVSLVVGLLTLAFFALGIWLYWNDYGLWVAIGTALCGFIVAAMSTPIENKLRASEEEALRRGRPWGAPMDQIDREKAGENLIFEITCIKPGCNGRIKERAGDSSLYRAYTYQGRPTNVSKYYTAGASDCTACGARYLLTFHAGPHQYGPRAEDLEGKLMLEGSETNYLFDPVNKPVAAK